MYFLDLKKTAIVFTALILMFAFVVVFGIEGNQKVSTTTTWETGVNSQHVLQIQKLSPGVLATEKDLVEAHKILEGDVSSAE